jgi:hypothetical protein
MRRYPRHTSSIPIELVVAASAAAPVQLDNVGVGGLACCMAQPLPVGSTVRLRIPLVWPDYQGRGVVVWCHPQPPGFEVGIAFDDEEAFKSKMVQQLCRIEQYRLQMYRQGRQLDGEQAAREWISHHAEEFAREFGPAADRRH